MGASDDRRPVISAKDRLAAARREQEQQGSPASATAHSPDTGVSGPDPVLMAKLAALQEDGRTALPQPDASSAPDPTPAPSLAERLADRRAALGDVRRDAGADVLEGLGAPATPASTDTAATAEATSTGPASPDEIDLISALRDLPAKSAAAEPEQPQRVSGKHKAFSAPARPAEPAPPADATIDPALVATLRALEAAETKHAPDRPTARADRPLTAEVGTSAIPARPTPQQAVPRAETRPPSDSARLSPSRPKADPGLRQRGREVADAPTSPKAPPGVVQFSPRRSTRQLLGALCLLTLLGAVGTGLLAWDTRATVDIAIAGTLALLTLILWSAFSTASPAKLTIDRGVLDVTARESRHRFDLASPYTEITTTGTPGKRGWRVQIHRRSMKPFVIDSSLVDPEEFQAVLDHYREVAAAQAAENERRRERR